MNNLEDAGRTKEIERFSQYVGEELDPVTLVLRTHLYAENMLERVIVARLPRGDKMIETGSLTFFQKLVLVDAFDCLEDSIISSLRQLNKLRNQCAHELNRKIVDSDITRLGSPLGKVFTRFKREANFDEATLLRMVLEYVCGYVAAEAFFTEHPDLDSKANKGQERKIE